jgi:uncharacterized membrane protein required for colicin V production
MNAAHLFDLAAALTIIVLGLIGFLRGFVSAVMSFLSLFCGTYFAWTFSGEGTALFLKYFPNVDESIASIVALTIIFFCVAAAISLISRLLCSLINFVRLSGLNHIAGMFIGLATGFVLIIAVYCVINNFAPEIGQGWMELSIFMKLAKEIWPYVNNFLISHGIFDFTKFILKQ